ncbi:MAG TPA: hypothetical protein EYP10_07020, partial [Armatimonadetes bacterium]|nr:hypothetical protein [Armatimonadota bacterium]
MTEVRGRERELEVAPSVTREPVHRISWRAILISLPLIIWNDYWVIQVEGIWHWGHPTCISLFWNVTLTIVMLILLNLIVRAIAPRYALQQHEFVIIYIMVTLSSALAGHDALQLGIPALAHPWWFASPANHWQELFWDYLPRWCTVPDLSALKGFYEGHTTFWTPYHFYAWLNPTLWWVSFITALAMVYVGLNCLLRRQWTEYERLSYPIIQLPMAITKDGGRSDFFLNAKLWWGILLAGGVDLMNGLHSFYPSVPLIKVRHNDMNYSFWFVNRPWRAMASPRPFWIPLYPFIIALGFLLPLDLSFSIWFFYLFRKFQQVIADAMGVWRPPEGAPYIRQQAFGAWTALGIHVLWLARIHLRNVIRELWHPEAQRARGEALSYRAATVLVIIGLGYMIWFSHRGGMSWGVSVLYFLPFIIWSLAITKMRAELGPPAHEMVPLNSAYLLVYLFGSERLGARNLTMMPLYWWFNGRGHRNHQMPIVLEGFKMAHDAGLHPRGLPWLMIGSMTLGGLTAYVSALHQCYNVGDNAMVAHNWGQWNQLAAWIQNPSKPNWMGITYMLIGGAFTAFLARMRMEFLWWPFHPAGYALALNFGVDYFWSCLLIAS